MSDALTEPNSVMAGEAIYEIDHQIAQAEEGVKNQSSTGFFTGTPTAPFRKPCNDKVVYFVKIGRTNPI